MVRAMRRSFLPSYGRSSRGPKMQKAVEGVEKMAKRSERTVLFLCTGNYYRSRFAEILFNSVAGKMGLPWRASSRGLALERGLNNIGPMALAAVKALEDRGLRGTADCARFPMQAVVGD